MNWNLRAGLLVDLLTAATNTSEEATGKRKELL